MPNPDSAALRQRTDCPWRTEPHPPTCAYCEHWQGPEPDAAATTMLSWKHPNPKAGEQEEPLCDEHLALVREALSTLGIGCIAWAPDEPTPCGRCGKQLPWRFYLFPSPPLYVSQSCPTCGDTCTSEKPIRIVEHVGPDNHVFDYPEGAPVDA